MISFFVFIRIFLNVEFPKDLNNFLDYLGKLSQYPSSGLSGFGSVNAK